MKRALTIFIALVMVLSLVSLVACSSNSGTQSTTSASASGQVSSSSAASAAATNLSQGLGTTKPIKAALIVKKKIEFFLNMQKGIEKELKALNAGNQLVVYSNDGDVNKEISNVEDVLSNKFDVLFICCQDIKGTTVSLKKAFDSGMKVIVLDSGCNDMDKYTCASITSNNVEAGEFAMEALAKAMGGKGKLAVFENTLQATDAERGEGRDKVLAKYPDINIVCRKNEQGTMENAYKAFSDFLVSNPDISGIWCLGDNSAAGAIAALKDLGYKPGKVPVVGIDCTTTGAQNIRDGWQLGSAMQFPDQIGAAGVKRAIEILNGADKTYQRILVPTKWIDLSIIDKYVAVPTPAQTNK